MGVVGTLVVLAEEGDGIGLGFCNSSLSLGDPSAKSRAVYHHISIDYPLSLSIWKGR